jgi:adenylate kinase family enzyme
VPDRQTPIGRRVQICGPTGSGKSTLGRQLGALLGVPVLELDAYYHLPGWEQPAPEEFRAKVAAALEQCRDGWVADGNYFSALGGLVLEQAETVIWLRLPLRVVFPRLVRRTFARAVSRELLWGTNRESFRVMFLSKDSLLLFCLTNWRPHIRRVSAALKTTPHHATIHVLRTPRQVRGFVARVTAGGERAATTAGEAQ